MKIALPYLKTILITITNSISQIVVEREVLSRC